MSDPIVPIDNSTAQDLEMFFLKQQRDQAQEDAAFWKLKYEAEELEKAALQSRLDALSQPDDEDAPTPAGLRAANAQLRKDRQMYSALVGQLKGQLQECEAKLQDRADEVAILHHRIDTQAEELRSLREAKDGRLRSNE